MVKFIIKTLFNFLNKIILLGYISSMKLLWALLPFVLACSSNPSPKLDYKPKCYFFLGGNVVQIKTDGDQAYLYSQFNNQDTFYWETLSYISNYYLPDSCPPELVKRAQRLLKENF